MKGSRSKSNNFSYQAKRIKKIVDSQMKVLEGLVALALQKGECIKENENKLNFVVYQDEMYRVQISVYQGRDGTIRPVGSGQIDCVAVEDVDYIKFCYDSQSRLSSYLNFQWGRAKGEIHFQAGQPSGFAEITEAIDNRFVKRHHVFASKTVSALLALATCTYAAGLNNAAAQQKCFIAHQGEHVGCDLRMHTR